MDAGLDHYKVSTTGQQAHTNHGQTSIFWARFEFMIPVFKLSKTAHDHQN